MGEGSRIRPRCLPRPRPRLPTCGCRAGRARRLPRPRWLRARPRSTGALCSGVSQGGLKMLLVHGGWTVRSRFLVNVSVWVSSTSPLQVPSKALLSEGLVSQIRPVSAMVSLSRHTAMGLPRSPFTNLSKKPKSKY